MGSSTLEASSHTDAGERFGIDSGACAFQIFMNTGQLDFSSRTWISIFPSPEICLCRLKIKKMSPANQLFLQSFPTVLPPVLALPVQEERQHHVYVWGSTGQW